MASCSAEDLLEVGKCYGCLDNRQIGMVELALLCNIWKESNPMADCDPNALMDSAKCFDCLDAHQRGMVRLQLLCEILESGGSGTNCNVCTEGADPVAAPPCDCSIYIRTDTGEMWYWRALTAEWIKFLSNT